MRILLALTMLLCSCQTTLIGSTEVLNAEGAPIAVVRTNGTQLFIQGEVAIRGEVMTESGIPVLLHEAGGDRMLYSDRDADLTIEGPIGTPVPVTVLELFPRPGELERYGIILLEE